MFFDNFREWPLRLARGGRVCMCMVVAGDGRGSRGSQTNDVQTLSAHILCIYDEVVTMETTSTQPHGKEGNPTFDLSME